MVTSLQSNIPKLYLIKFLKGFLFCISVTYLFFNSFGLNEMNLFVIQAVFALGVVLFEIPTWFVSDKYSRKWSLVLWCFLWAVAHFLYWISTSFWWFVVAEVLLALWFCCVSGTDTAMLYDTLQWLWREWEYKKFSGRYASLGNFAEAVGWLSGWLIALYFGLDVPFFLDAIFYFFAGLLALTLVEPTFTRLSEDVSSWKQLKGIIKFCWTHAWLRWLMTYSALIGTITISMVRFSQPFLVNNNVPTEYFGIFWMVFNLAVSMFWLFAHRIEEKIWQINFMLLLIVVSFVCLVTIGLYPYLAALPLFFVFQFVRGGSRVVVNDWLHLAVSSEKRATVQSVNSMLFRLSFAVFGPIFGYLSSQITLWPTLIVLACVLCSLAFISYRKYEGAIS